MKWIDSEVTESTFNPTVLNVLSIATAYVLIFLSFILLFSSSFNLSFQDRLMVVLFVCALFFWVYGGFFSVIEERRFVRNIKVTASSVEIENAFHKIKKIRVKDIKYVSDIEEKWILPKPHYWKVGKKGLTIKLNNGKFYRISPHMENIEELKTKLDKLIDEYKS